MTYVLFNNYYELFVKMFENEFILWINGFVRASAEWHRTSGTSHYPHTYTTGGGSSSRLFVLFQWLLSAAVGPFAQTFSSQYVIRKGRNLRIHIFNSTHAHHTKFVSTAYRSVRPFKLCENGTINFFQMIYAYHVYGSFIHSICCASNKHMSCGCVTKCELKLAPSTQGLDFFGCWHFSFYSGRSGVDSAMVWRKCSESRISGEKWDSTAWIGFVCRENLRCEMKTIFAR